MLSRSMHPHPSHCSEHRPHCPIAHRATLNQTNLAVRLTFGCPAQTDMALVFALRRRTWHWSWCLLENNINGDIHLDVTDEIRLVFRMALPGIAWHWKGD